MIVGARSSLSPLSPSSSGGSSSLSSLSSFRSTFSDNSEYAMPAENGQSLMNTVGYTGGEEMEKDGIQDALRSRNV